MKNVLTKTIEKYLEWVKPVLAEAEFQETKRIATKFLETEGPLLQERLVRWCEEHRYFDKNLQVIYNTKGDLGFNMARNQVDYVR